MLLFLLLLLLPQHLLLLCFFFPLLLFRIIGDVVVAIKGIVVHVSTYGVHKYVLCMTRTR